MSNEYVAFSNKCYVKEDPLTNKAVEMKLHSFPFWLSVKAPYQEVLLCNAN